MKKIIAANISKVVEFGNTEDFENHIQHLEKRKRAYEVLSKREMDNGRILVKMKEQYNDTDLL